VGFDILAVRATDDDQIVDGMYPVPCDDGFKIAPEPPDGDHVKRFAATAVSAKLDLGDRTRRIAEARKIKADVVVTDQRVAISCEKYDQGGGWVNLGGGAGGAVLNLGINAASKIKAAQRSRQKVLVGHVRYQWLRSVGYRSKGGVIKVQHVRLGIADGMSDPLRPVALDIELSTSVSAAEFARDIVARATAFWLDQNAVPTEHVNTFRGLADREPVTRKSDGSEWRIYSFPFYVSAMPQTALLARSRPATPDAGTRRYSISTRSTRSD
jgi:hypothetical protein